MVKKTMWAAIQDQRRAVPPLVTADLTGQTVVVVGANTGLGFGTAVHFARMNPGKLILACRNEEKGKAAVAKLRSETGFQNVELRLLDLSSFASVRAFSDSFQKDPRLDILVANAAVAANKYQLTSDGWEESIQVNDLSTSLLCLLLAPLMVSTGRTHKTNPRICIVTSDLHYFNKIDDKVFNAPNAWQMLNSEEYCLTSKMTNRYPETKLLNVFFARSLASLLSNTPVIVNTPNPGFCKSELRRNMPAIVRAISSLVETSFARTTEEGSRQFVYAAVGGAGNVDEMRGQYIDLHEVAEPTDFVLGEDGQRRQDKLWADLMDELTKVDARVADIVSQCASSYI